MSAARQPSPTVREEAAPVPSAAKKARTPRARRAAPPHGVRPAPALGADERARLLEGRHHDPHAVLGARTQRGGVAFRVLRPHAKAVTILAKGLRAELFDDGDGLFSGLLPLTGVPEYRLLVAYDSDEIEVHDPYRFLPALGELDLHLIGEGRHEQLWKALGAEPMEHQGVAGTRFTVWAPNAQGVRVTGDFSYWDSVAYPMRSLGSTGVWELFLPGVGVGTLYKYDITRPDGSHTLRADPMARSAEVPRRTPRWSPRPGTSGRTRRGWPGAAPGPRTRPRSRCTSCTWRPGGRGSPTGSSPSSSPRTSRSWASRTWS